MTRMGSGCAAAALLVVLLGAPPSVAARTGEPCARPWPEVVRELGPAVVSITAMVIDPFAARERVTIGHGSGVVLSDALEVITNAHVVVGARLVLVTLAPGRSLPAETVGIDPVLDLALLRVPLPPDAQDRPPVVAAPLGPSAAAEVGDDVLALGNPLGLGLAASRGIVSALDRVVPISTTSWLSPFIQTDAAVNPGNSGGPLVDACGRVVGITTMMVAGAQNLAFAVPSDELAAALPQLRARGRVIRPWHGLFGQIYDDRLRAMIPGPEVAGFLIETVEPGSPAAAIGLQGGTWPVQIAEHEVLVGGDILVEVDGQPIPDLRTARRIVAGLEVGQTVRLRYWREGAIHEAEVTLPERPILPQDLLRLSAGRHGG